MPKETKNLDLENQIGNIGGETVEDTNVESTEPSTQKSEGLGIAPLFASKKLSNNNESDDFRAKTDELYRGGSIVGGWIPIDREELNGREMFYPEDWQFSIKAADVQSIKNWSAIDENQVLSINKSINEILQSCVRISLPNGRTINVNKLHTWDRMWFLLKIREYTMVKGERAYAFEDECTCGAPVHFDLNYESLSYELPDMDNVGEYYDAERQLWRIDPNDFDVRGREMVFYLPTIEKDDVVVAWIYERARSNKKIDEMFAKYLSWLIPSVPVDGKQILNTIKDCEILYKQWSKDQFELAEEILKNITVDAKEYIVSTCESCGAEVHSEITFPGGLKNMFTNPTNKRKKFGTK